MPDDAAEVEVRAGEASPADGGKTPADADAARDDDVQAQKEAAALASVQKRADVDLVDRAKRMYVLAMLALCLLAAGFVLALSTGFALDTWFRTSIVIGGAAGDPVVQFTAENLTTIRGLHYAGTLLILVGTLGYLMLHHAFVGAYEDAPIRNRKRKPMTSTLTAFGALAFLSLCGVVVSGFQMPEKIAANDVIDRANERPVFMGGSDQQGDERFDDEKLQFPTRDARFAYDLHVLLLPCALGFTLLLLLGGAWTLGRCRIRESDAPRKIKSK